MRLVNLDVFAGGLFVLGHEGGVQVFVKLARHVIRHVQQSGLGAGNLHSKQSNAGERKPCFLFEVHCGFL